MIGEPVKYPLLAHWRKDLPASIVVFLVALPLCLGIALASNAPMFSGIIAGIIGGIVVGMVSGSALGVSGPAAGLAAIVISSIQLLGSWEAFLLAGVLAGVLQLIAGFFRGGIIAYYFPSSVIKGMLSGIGIIIIIKQIPHLLGHDVTSIMEPNGHLDILEIQNALDFVNPSTDRELKAQGIGNMLSCLLGGLPVTQVIVRSSANLTFGAKTKLSTIMHGVLLLLCALFIPAILNKIPLASLATVLTIIGYKLANPKLFKQMLRLGWEQYLPFFVTIAGMLTNDLLFGVSLGFAVAVFIIMRNNYLNSHNIIKITAEKDIKYHVSLAEQVSFLNKGSIIHELKNIPNNVTVIIDGSHSKVIDPDVREVIANFLLSAKTRNIRVELIGV